MLNDHASSLKYTSVKRNICVTFSSYVDIISNKVFYILQKKIEIK